ncbi:MAG: FAD binding domain-containing protein [Actinomycetota bacterium]
MTHQVQLPGTRVAHVVTPATRDAVLHHLAAPNTRIVAGGTDLLVELDRGGHGEVTTLIDITRVSGLDTIEEVDGRIVIGPMVTHNQCVASDLLRRKATPLVQACWEVGSPQLRNRATVAGNIVTASPANDTLSPLIALGATVTLTSQRGERTMPLAKFHRGVRRTAIEADELLTAISFPAMDRRTEGIYLKLGLRRAQAISVVHLAVVGRLGDERSSGVSLENARIALGSVGPTIIRAVEAERLLAGRPLTDELIAEAAALAGGAVNPIDDLRATADYRRALVAEMVARALAALHDGTGVVPDRPALLWGTSSGRWPTGDGFAAEHGHSTEIEATINGAPVSEPGAGENLLDWLRATGATGTKEGCAEGECGSCTVHLDGMAVLSCLVPATRAHGAEVVTIEGLAGTSGGPALDDPASEDSVPDDPLPDVPLLKGPAPSRLHPLQDAFVACGAVQCGFCIPGLLMSGAKLLEEHPTPTDQQITAGLSGNLCRCTGYYKVEDAVRVALGNGTATAEVSGSHRAGHGEGNGTGGLGVDSNGHGPGRSRDGRMAEDGS